MSALLISLVISGIAMVPAQAGSIALNADGASADAVAAVESAIRNFESSLASRAGCIGSATVTFEVLSGRKGEYRTASAGVVINPDREVASMAATVYHELAHHAMLTCRAYRDAEFTEAFYAAQGLPAERGWFDASGGWSGIPAEHFAEAVVALISGGTTQIAVTPAGLDVVRRWINGQAMPSSAPSPSVPEAIEVAPAPAATATSEGTTMIDETAPDRVAASAPASSQPSGPTGSPTVVLSAGVRAAGQVGDAPPGPVLTPRCLWVRPI